MDYMEALTVLVTLLACIGPILVFIYMIPKNLKGRFILFSFFLISFFFPCDKSLSLWYFSFNVKAHDGPSVCY